MGGVDMNTHLANNGGVQFIETKELKDEKNFESSSCVVSFGCASICCKYGKPTVHAKAGCGIFQNICGCYVQDRR
jgi:hypothetical protein